MGEWIVRLGCFVLGGIVVALVFRNNVAKASKAVADAEAFRKNAISEFPEICFQQL